MYRLLGVVVVCLLFGVSGILAQDKGECDGLTPVGLVVGQEARVAAGTVSNNVRDVPSLDGKRLGAIAGGTRVKVLDGPRCVGDLVWWQIESQDLTGWTVDRIDGQQRLFLATPESPVLSTTVITPDNADQLEALRTLSCPRGNNFVPLVAWNAHYYTQSCYTSIDVMDIATGARVLGLSVKKDGLGKSSYPLTFVDETTLLWIADESWYSTSGPQITILHLTNVITGEEIASAVNLGTNQSFFKHIFFANKTRMGLVKNVDQHITLEVRDTSTLELLDTYVLDQSNDGSFDYAISEDGTQVALIWSSYFTSNGNGSTIVKVYRVGTSEPPAVIDIPADSASNSLEVALSPSGNYVLVAFCDGSGELSYEPPLGGFYCVGANITWFATKDGARVTRWSVPFNDIGNMEFGAGDVMMMSSPNGKVLYDVETGQVLRVFKGHSPVGMFNNEGTLMFAHGEDGTFIWGIPQ